MKIGFFTSIEGWGGSEIYLKNLILGLKKKNIEVILFGINKSRLFKELSDLKVTCIPWKGLISGNSDKACHNNSGTNFNNTKKKKDKFYIKNCILKLTPFCIKLLMGNILEANNLYKLFKKNCVDLMHINVHGYEVAAIACRLNSIPCVGSYRISRRIEVLIGLDDYL